MPADLHLLPKFRDRLAYLYAEHAVVEREQNAIVLYLEEGEVPVPVAEIALLMLGPGTKLSHAAVDVLARNNCLVAWVGEEGVRLYAFGTGGTHSSARLLRQAAAATDESRRLAVVRCLYAKRFPEALSPEISLEQIRGMEGHRVRSAYRLAADRYGLEWQGRNYDRNRWQGSDPPNRALSAANSCLYGVCHAAILSLGFSPALGFIHVGKQLSFVYDVADLYKIELCLPVAFREAAQGAEDLERRVRIALRDEFRRTRFLERVAADLLELFPDPAGESTEEWDEDPAKPGAYWDGAPGGVDYSQEMPALEVCEDDGSDPHGG
ncbi:MAG: type I-E CRISPR-associated endonuclease Cas1e [Fimbriimonadales bacterium]|nr:type I-E CRISPR-associated endonuclease Cas1e [Fimbriimonadales bacterium]